MYVEDKRHLPLETVKQWLELAKPFWDPPPGCPGSYFAPYGEAKRIFAPALGDHFHAVQQITLVGLLPSAQIVGHKDAEIPGRRIHIPLQTNPGCWSFSGTIWQRLQVKSGYWMDPTVVHGAVNWGETVRLHLVVDVG
jgi:hypothetical protein